MIYSIQYIRALAAIIIVFTHVHDVLIAGPAGKLPMDLSEVNIAFTFAAGFLFKHLAIDEPTVEFLKRRAINVLVPYVLISIPAIIIYAAGMKDHPNVALPETHPVILSIYFLITGLHLGPLWFIPMIFILYLASPVFKQVDRMRFGYAIALPISFILAITVFERPEFNHIPPLAAAHYVPIFLLGMYSSKNYIEVSSVSKRLWPMFLLAFLILAYVSVDAGKDYQFALKASMLICIFMISIRLENYRYRFVDILANWSFGIYFTHGYIVGVLRASASRGLISLEATWLNAVWLTTAVVVICLISIWALKFVFGRHSRLIIGS